MTLPEVQIKKILDGVLLAIRKDTIANNLTPNNSFLYRLLSGNVAEKWNYYTQGLDIFNRTSDHPRLLETRLFFDRSRAAIPTVHITLPNLQGANDGIGFDEGYVDNFESQAGIAPNIVYTSVPVYTRGFQTTYHLIITSDNAFEVLTIYHVLKAGLIGNIESFEYYGLRNVKFSGQDLQIDDRLVPPGIFSRGIGLNLFYEMEVPTFRSLPNVSDITPITGTPIESETEKIPN